MDRQQDEAAVARALKGDDSAFAELLGRYRDRIFTFLLRLAGDARDAEDLAQEAFLRAFTKLESYDRSRPFISWLFRIAHNLAVDFLRAKDPESLELDEAPEQAHPELTPEQRAMAGSQGEILERLLDAMPALYREPLLLRYKEGLELNQVAEVLGMPEGTAKIRLFRAREMLKGKLEACGISAETL